MEAWVEPPKWYLALHRSDGRGDHPPPEHDEHRQGQDHPRQHHGRGCEVKCSLPRIARAWGRVVDICEYHRGQDGDGALEAGQHGEHLACLLGEDAAGHLAPDRAREQAAEHLHADAGVEHGAGLGQGPDDLSRDDGDWCAHYDDVVVDIEMMKDRHEEKYSSSMYSRLQCDGQIVLLVISLLLPTSCRS